MQQAGAAGSTELRKLTEQDISKMFSPKILERGIEYFEEGRLQRPFVYRSSIMAECQGTQPENYHISIDVRDGNVVASCTCPYAFGYCKHIAAALYGWVKRPSAFADLGKSEEVLSRLDRSQIVEIVMDMIRYDPDVMYVINLRLRPVEELPDYTRRETAAIFSEEYVDYLNVREIVKKLDIFREYASDLAREKKTDTALAVVEPVIDAIVTNYTRLDDADALLANFFGAAMDMYGSLLSGIKDEGKLRIHLTRALDWYMDAEWGLENDVLKFLADYPVRLGQNKYMIDAVELKISDFKRSFISTSPKYSEEHEYIDERIGRLNIMRSELRRNAFR